MVALTPLDIQGKEFKRTFRGYDENDVEDFLDDVLRDYELLYKENNDLKEKLNRMEGRIEEYKSIEDTLKNTLIVAQETAKDVSASSQREAERIIEDARSKSRKMIEDAEWQVERLASRMLDAKRQMSTYLAKAKGLLHAQVQLLEDPGFANLEIDVEDELINVDSMKDFVRNNLQADSQGIEVPPLVIAGEDAGDSERAANS